MDTITKTEASGYFQNELKLQHQTLNELNAFYRVIRAASLKGCSTDELASYSKAFSAHIVSIQDQTERVQKLATIVLKLPKDDLQPLLREYHPQLKEISQEMLFLNQTIKELISSRLAHPNPTDTKPTVKKEDPLPALLMKLQDEESEAPAKSTIKLIPDHLIKQENDESEAPANADLQLIQKPSITPILSSSAPKKQSPQTAKKRVTFQEPLPTKKSVINKELRNLGINSEEQARQLSEDSQRITRSRAKK